VAKHIKVCHLCQIHKERKTSERQPLQSVDVISRTAFSDVSMDIVAGEFPVTSRRNRYLLTIVCNVTGWLCAYPMPNCKADTVADKLLDFCCDKAFPEIIRSNNFTSFRSQLITAVREKFGIEMKLSAPYHAASHGKIERHNRSIQDMLRKFISDHPRDWDQIIKFLLYALREVPNASTGYLPYQLVYGTKPRGILKLIRETWTGEDKHAVKTSLPVTRYLEKLETYVREAVEAAGVNGRRAHDRNKTIRDCLTKERHHEP